MKLSEDLRSCLRNFAFLLANGSLGGELLDGFDYRKALMETGTPLEVAFAIWGNVVEVGEDGKVSKAAQADWRAAQWIRQFCDPAYVVKPPFAPWEVELH